VDTLPSDGAYPRRERRGIAPVQRIILKVELSPIRKITVRVLPFGCLDNLVELADRSWTCSLRVLIYSIYYPSRVLGKFGVYVRYQFLTLGFGEPDSSGRTRERVV
jgi:hypothetical protein